MRWVTFTVLFALPSLLLAQTQPSELLSTRPKIEGKLSLRQAVEIALRESPVLRGAVAELKAAEAKLQMMRSEKRLQLSVNTFASMGTEGGILTSPSTVMPSATMLLPRRSFVDANAMLMFPLFTGGRLEALIRQAEALRHATQARLEAMRLDVALETKIAYRQALLMRQMVRVAEAYVRAMEERVRIDKVAADVGRIPEFWVLRSEAELANARQMLVNAQRDYEIAILTLKTVMGIHPDSQVELTDEFSADETLPIPLEREKLLATAFENRPEIRRTTQQVNAQNFALQAAKALYAPQVGLMAMADYMRGTGGMGQGTGGYLVGIVLGLPILDGGRRKATVNEAEAMREKALADLEQVKLQIVREVDTALRELLAARQNVQTARAALHAAEEDARVAKVRYEAGRSVLVEYLDAVAALVRAQLNHAQAVYDLAVARDRLIRAVGETD
ncbi:Outer membrane efflux protein BepC [bacterium HR17]|uniref:Outer membrane efflux protein BepC n=1 Tax=Candidatus Fervidibacter japonicus TaxID=2035412 RepID=A0A2H5XC75_9BACT|nr:Outer membrane efflux protein BepC [bacterium HR17]